MIEDCVLHNTPVIAANLGLQLSRDPRFLKSGATLSAPIVLPARSVLAGCSTSTSFARASMLTVVDCDCRIAAEEGASAHTALHVDDLSHTIVASSAVAARKATLRIALKFAEQMKRRDLRISSKSVFIADGPDPAFAKDIERDLRRAMIQQKSVSHTEDLGADAGSAGRRHTSAAKKRKAKADERTRRARWLGTLGVNVKSLYATGVKPQGTPCSDNRCFPDGAPTAQETCGRFARACRCAALRCFGNCFLGRTAP